MPARYTLHFTAPGRVPLEIPTSTGRAPVTFSENPDKSPLIAGRAPAGTRQDSGKVSVMPRSHFTKGAFPSSSLAVFGRFLTVPHGNFLDPDREPSIFSPRAGPALLLILKESTRDIPARAPYGTRKGACLGPDAACRDTGGVPPVPIRCPNGSRSGPLNNLQGIVYTVTEIRIYQSTNQSINKSTNQSKNVGY